MVRERLGTLVLEQGWPTCGACARNGALDAYRSDALHPFDDKTVSHSYSLILVILFFLDALSSSAMFLLDQSGFTLIKI